MLPPRKVVGLLLQRSLPLCREVLHPLHKRLFCPSVPRPGRNAEECVGLGFRPTETQHVLLPRTFYPAVGFLPEPPKLNLKRAGTLWVLRTPVLIVYHERDFTIT